MGLQAHGNGGLLSGGVSGGFFVGYSSEKGFSAGFRGTVGGGTGIGFGAGVGGFAQVTDAESVCDLKGKGFDMEASAREGPSIGLSGVGGLDDNNKQT